MINEYRKTIKVDADRYCCLSMDAMKIKEGKRLVFAAKRNASVIVRDRVECSFGRADRLLPSRGCPPTDNRDGARSGRCQF